MKNIALMIALFFLSLNTFAAGPDLNGVYLGSCDRAGVEPRLFSIQSYLVIDLEQNFIHEGRLTFSTSDCSGKPNRYSSFNTISVYTSFGMTITSLDGKDSDQVKIHAKNPNAYSADTLTATYIFNQKVKEGVSYFSLIRIGHSQILDGVLREMGADARLMSYATRKPLSFFKSLQ